MPYDAVKIDGPALKDRLAGPKAIRNQAKADAGRAQLCCKMAGHAR